MSQKDLSIDGELMAAAMPADASKAQAILDRRQLRPEPPKIDLTDEGNIAMCGENGALSQLRAMASLGLHNAHALSLVLHQMTHLNPSAYNRRDSSHVNSALAMFEELEPEGGNQSMLAAQMVALHVAAMDCFRRAAIPDQTFDGRDLNLKFGVKLGAAYARHAETLSKLKRNGQQTVNVGHVNVHDGGQAIVGGVSAK